jgi:hypothetical protein
MLGMKEEIPDRGTHVLLQLKRRESVKHIPVSLSMKVIFLCGFTTVKNIFWFYLLY